MALGILLLLVEYWIPLSRTRRALMVIAAAPLLLLASVTEARASTIGTYIRNRAGLRAFDSGDLEGAKEKFGAAQSSDPNSVEPVFNQGVVQLKEETPSRL